MSARDWLADFAARVRERDVDGALPLFDPACLSFGTRVEVARDRESLAADQWTPIWHATTGFDFTEIETVATGPDVVVAATRWTSVADLDGRTRTGRATVVLRADPDAPHGWLCTHTHFSAPPDPEPL